MRVIFHKLTWVTLFLGIQSLSAIVFAQYSPDSRVSSEVGKDKIVVRHTKTISIDESTLGKKIVKYEVDLTRYDMKSIITLDVLENSRARYCSQLLETSSVKSGIESVHIVLNHSVFNSAGNESTGHIYIGNSGIIECTKTLSSNVSRLLQVSLGVMKKPEVTAIGQPTASTINIFGISPASQMLVDLYSKKESCIIAKKEASLAAELTRNGYIRVNFLTGINTLKKTIDDSIIGSCKFIYDFNRTKVTLDSFINNPPNHFLALDNEIQARHTINFGTNIDTVVRPDSQKYVNVTNAAKLRHAISQNHKEHLVCGPKDQLAWYNDQARVANLEVITKRLDRFLDIRINNYVDELYLTQQYFKELKERAFLNRTTTAGCEDLQRLVKAINVIYSLETVIQQTGIYQK